MSDVHEQFGQIDIYLFDQILRDRVLPGQRILDAGCGGGRNLIYFLRAGYDVFGVDQDAQAVYEVQRMTAVLAPRLPLSNFRVETLEGLSFADSFFDFVICSAVLHFAENDRQFRDMLSGMWKVLKPGGILFCRLASSIGMQMKNFRRIAGRRFLLPDGSERYLVDEALLEKLAMEMKAELVDPIKTSVVQNQRCMTTWIIRKPGAGIG